MSLESGHLQTSVYGAESKVLQPVKLLKAIWQDALASRQLAMILAVRDLRAQYRQSFFGLFWILAPPIVVAVGLSVAQENKLVNFGTASIPNGAFIMIGMSVWQVFAAAVMAPLQVMGSYRGVVTKVVVPPEAIIMSSFVKLSITIALQMVLIFFTFLWFKLPISATTPLGIPALLCAALFGTAMGLLIMPIGLLYRDIALAIPIFENLWLAGTPTVYAAVQPLAGKYFWATKVNPMTPLVSTTRQLLAGEHVTMAPQFLTVVGLTFVLAFLGLILVRVAMPLVIERWSA